MSRVQTVRMSADGEEIATRLMRNDRLGRTLKKEVRQMPIHLEDLDVVSEVAGLRSALIVPCNMCAAASVAARENKPFIQFFKSFLTSAPFAQHIRDLQARLRERGVDAHLFRSNLPHQWFLCMCTSGRRKKLERYARHFDAAIVLGCVSAVETVRDSVASTNCKVVPGMVATGVMNAKLRVRLPGNVSFEDCKIVPISRQERKERMAA